LRNRIYIKFLKGSKYILVLTTFLNLNFSKAQIANYIQNGGFEQTNNCLIPVINSVKFWRSIDSSMSANVGLYGSCFSTMPQGTLTYQLTKNGNYHCISSFYCQSPFPACQPNASRGYLRNRLKSTLIAGKTYCVKFYVNISNPSTYGISSMGAYFGDNSLDTITQVTRPLTYLSPQIENPATNIITDTLGWSLITGTFVATGIEKHCVIGNFKSDVNTNKILINPTSLPTIFCDVLIDDVSCIPTDLPAYAGADIWGIPSATVYIGRQRDVGIDEACTWYNMSNTLTPIANAAGLTLTVALSTQTYMVKQDICGIIKYDTVIVHASALGNSELQYFKNQIKVYPQPANDKVSIELTANEIANNFTEFVIYSTLGQVIRREELEFTKSPIKQVDVTDLPNGYYTLSLHTTKGYVIKQSLVISK
jgi:hypothetical protein